MTHEIQCAVIIVFFTEKIRFIDRFHVFFPHHNRIVYIIPPTFLLHSYICSNSIVTLLKCAALQATNNNNTYNTRGKTENAEMDFPAMTSIVFGFVEPYRFSSNQK